MSAVVAAGGGAFGALAVTVQTPPLSDSMPSMTPLLVKPPLKDTLPLVTVIVPLLTKSDVTLLTPPPPVFSNRPLLMKNEAGVPAIPLLETMSYSPALATVAVPPIVAAPEKSSRPDSAASRLKTSDSGPEIEPEKFTAPRVKVAGPPLS